MSAQVQHGYFFLADIAGYTPYLAGVELDHAHEILTDLLETILERFKPLLSIDRVEGDAVFAYAPGERIPRGEAVLDLVESTYTAFRDRREAIHRRTTCTCNACRNIPALDLKFVVHYGEYLLQHVGKIVEPIGSDVNLAHRLMKNNVSATTGWRAYALYTQPAVAHMQLALEGAVPSSESYEHLGSVEIESVDMQARYAELLDARHVVVEPGKADCALEFDYSAAPAIAWEWFQEPHKRSQWMMADVVPVLRVGGRQAPGARNHCVHGKDDYVVEDVLDIKPYEYFTVDHRPPNGPMALRMTFWFKPTPAGGTHLTLTFFGHGEKMPRFAAKKMTSHIVSTSLQQRWKLADIQGMIDAEESRK